MMGLKPREAKIRYYFLNISQDDDEDDCYDDDNFLVL